MMKNEWRGAIWRNRRLAGVLSLLLAGGIGGGALAATSSASAADSTPSAAASAPAASGAQAPADRATSVRAGEKELTGTTLVTLKAAALKAVPGGTVDRVETDADGSAYEAHMTKADGTRVTVKFDKNLKVTATQDGMGTGGPGGPGGMRPGGPGASDGAAPSATSEAGV